MRGLSVGVSLGVSVACGVFACSAGKTNSGTRPEANAGSGNAATGGQSGAGVVTYAGTGSAGSGFVPIDEPDPVDAGPDAPEEAGVCDDLSIQTFEAVPTVQILVDTSGSMFQPREQLWDPLFKALTDPTNGVIAMLQSKVRFGFTSYTGHGGTECPTLVSTDLKLNNFETIKTAYTDVGVKTALMPNGETPTGASVAAISTSLQAFKPDPPGPKFILLVTDGDPDTCAQVNPQCGQDESIKAVQDAYKAGIGTFVIGIGDIVGSDPSQNQGMRVGKLHLQDIANAGTGQPVAPNNDAYLNQPCIKDKTVTATYAATVAEGGTAPYFTVSAKDGTTAQKQIADAIVASLAQTRSCTFNMDAKVTGDASKGTLTYNGTPLTFGDPNGWTLGADLTSVTLGGTTCDSWKKDGGKVNVVFPCKLVPVVHVEVPPPT